MKPTMKRVQTAKFIVEDNKTYRLYMARLTWPNGKIKDFPSEEHANAWLEDRPVNFIPFKTP